MQSETKFIVWDWNGTVIDDTPVNLDCFNVILKTYGKQPIDLDAYQRTFEVPIKHFYLRNQFSAEEYDLCREEAQKLFHKEYDERILTVGFREGAAAVLSTTLDISHIVLSNHLIHSIASHLERMQAQQWFADILAHGSVDEQNGWVPKSERLRKYMAAHDLHPRNGIIVGDTEEEVQIGHEMGIVSVGITGGFAAQSRIEAAKPDHLIHSLIDLPAILNERGFLA
jgi:phosphoglycolate phosphatase-like HAD superfamily hydrolase